MYLIKLNDYYHLFEAIDELNSWAVDAIDEDGEDPGVSFDGCLYMQFEFKPTGKIKVLPAEPRRFQLVKKK